MEIKNRIYSATLSNTHKSCVDVYEKSDEDTMYSHSWTTSYDTPEQLLQWVADNKITLYALDDRRDEEEVFTDAEAVARSFGVGTWKKEGSTTVKLTGAELLEAIKERLAERRGE